MVRRPSYYLPLGSLLREIVSAIQEFVLSWALFVSEFCYVTVASLKLRGSGGLAQPSGSCDSDSTLPHVTRTNVHHLILLTTITQSFPCEVASLRVVILRLFIECCRNWPFILSSVPQISPVFHCSSSGYQVTRERNTWETGVDKQRVDSHRIQ